MDIIEKYKTELEAFENACRRELEQAIRDELDKLEDGESIPLNSHNCDGSGIAILTYSDAINRVNKDGGCIIYNNNECSDGIAHDDADVFGFPLEVTVEILKSVREHMSKRELLAISSKLEEIAKKFDDVQNLSKNKGNEINLSSRIESVRCSIEDIKEDIEGLK